MVILIGLCAFATAALTAAVFGYTLGERQRRLRARIDTIAGGGVIDPGYSGKRLLRFQNYSNLPFLREVLERSARAERLADDLDRAAIPLRVGEYLMFRVASGLIVALLVWLLLPTGVMRVIAAVLLALIGSMVPRFILKWRINRRRNQIEEALPDALDIIARSLRAGGGLLSAIDTVVEQIDGPISDELARTREEISVGLSVEDAFRDLDRRLQSGDIHILVTAIQIQREVGGNLAEILDNVSRTIRERYQLRNEMRSITARQRLTSYLIACVPPLIVLVLALIAYDSVRPLFERTGGHIVLAIALGLELAGILMIRQLIASYEV
jgi:tight adherence protein B